MGFGRRRFISPEHEASVADDEGDKFFANDAAEPLLNREGSASTVGSSVESYGGSGARRASLHAAAAANADVKPTNAQVSKSLVAVLVAAGGATAFIVAFTFVDAPALVASIMLYVAGGICLMNFPLVLYKEKRILFSSSLSQIVEHLQNAAEALQAEADILEGDIDYMTSHLSSFGDIEQELDEIVRRQGSTVSEVLHLVRENEITMYHMRENLRQKVVQDVIEITIRSGDKYSERRIDRVEAKLLALKITVRLESYGITFDEDKFMRAVNLNPTLRGIVGTVRKLLPPDRGGPTDDDEESAADPTTMNADASTVTSTARADDIYDMFYMARDDSALSVRSGASDERGQTSLAARRRLLIRPT